MPREQTDSGQKYLCSNPNCKNVFSRPKIIKYHVCPACQTLVDIKEVADEEEIQIVLATQNLKRRKPKIVETRKLPEQSEIDIQITDGPVKVEEPRETEEKIEESEQAIPLEPIPIPTQESVEFAPTQQTVAVDTNTPSPTSSGCQYGFGYLSQRGKGEGIPSTCIECAKSLDCMLSTYYKKEESVKEIKKWYS